MAHKKSDRKGLGQLGRCSVPPIMRLNRHRSVRNNAGVPDGSSIPVVASHSSRHSSQGYYPSMDYYNSWDYPGYYQQPAAPVPPRQGYGIHAGEVRPYDSIAPHGSVNRDANRGGVSDVGRDISGSYEAATDRNGRRRERSRSR